MLTESEFRTKYGIEDAEWQKAKLHWPTLEDIFSDHLSRSAQLQLTGAYIADRLRQVEQVHSLKFRIKDPEHVIEKVVRKSIATPELALTSENYREALTDLVGVRALHLFKEDWPAINDAIVDTWELHETPVANVRKGDPDEMTTLFTGKGGSALRQVGSLAAQSHYE
jgi:putative GTP pyrophosphokinase